MGRIGKNMEDIKADGEDWKKNTKFNIACSRREDFLGCFQHVPTNLGMVRRRLILQTKTSMQYEFVRLRNVTAVPVEIVALHLPCKVIWVPQQGQTCR